MTSQLECIAELPRIVSSYVKTETEWISQHIYKWNPNQFVFDSEHVLSLYQISIVDVTWWFTVAKWLTQLSAMPVDGVHAPASATCQT